MVYNPQQTCEAGDYAVSYEHVRKFWDTTGWFSVTTEELIRFVICVYLSRIYRLIDDPTTTRCIVCRSLRLASTWTGCTVNREIIRVKSCTMADVECFRKAFKEFHIKLTELPINDMIEELYTKNLLPGDHKAKVKSQSTPKEMAQHFLDAVIKPSLEIGYTQQFEQLISIMESSDNPALPFLAQQIRESMAGVPTAVLHSSSGKGKRACKV